MPANDDNFLRQLHMSTEFWKSDRIVGNAQYRAELDACLRKCGFDGDGLYVRHWMVKYGSLYFSLPDLARVREVLQANKLIDLVDQEKRAQAVAGYSRWR